MMKGTFFRQKIVTYFQDYSTLFTEHKNPSLSHNQRILSSLFVSQVFSYLLEVFRLNPKFRNSELIILAKYFIKISLDKIMKPVLSIIKDLIGACIQAIDGWDSFKVRIFFSFNINLNIFLIPRLN